MAPWKAGIHNVRFDVSAPAPAWRNLGFHAELRNVPAAPSESVTGERGK